MSRAVLIDYGSGNLRSAEKALLRAAAERPGAPEVVTTWPSTMPVSSTVWCMSMCRSPLVSISRSMPP